MDLSKLTPAPWEPVPVSYIKAEEPHAWIVGNGRFSEKEDADRVALMRNALDVMMRRGWHAESKRNKVDGVLVWTVEHWQLAHMPFGGAYADPFTALVEAEKWYKANVEKVPA